MTNSEAVKATLARKLVFINGYMANKGCATCGEHNPACLDLVGLQGVALAVDKITEHLQDYRVLCANCQACEAAEKRGPLPVPPPLKRRSPKLEKLERALGLEVTLPLKLTNKQVGG